MPDRPRRLLDNLLDRDTLAGGLLDRARTTVRHEAAEQLLDRTVQRPVRSRVDQLLEEARARRR